MKPSLKVIVRGTKVTAELTDVLTSGMKGVPVEFQFDKDWGDLRKLGVFKGSGQKKYLDLNLGGELTIPWEVLTAEQTDVLVGVEWRKPDGTVVIPTRWANVAVTLPGAQAGNDPALKPTPTVYDQIMQAIDEGRLKGADGLTPYIGENGNWWLGEEDTGIKAEAKDGYTPVKGVDYEDGIRGYTPQRGVDYWTEADQQEINAHIAEEVATLGDHSTIVCEAKGESIFVTDSAKAKLCGLVMYGKSEQFTTTGANLLEFESYRSITPGYDYEAITVNQNPFPGAGAYIYTCSGTIGKTYRLLVYNNGGMFVNVSSGSTFTLTEDEAKSVTQVKIVVEGLSIGAANTGYVYPMIAKGTTSLPYEPYTGGKPSPSPEYQQNPVIPGQDGDIGVKVCGANLLNIPDSVRTENGMTMTCSNGAVHLSGTKTSWAGMGILGVMNGTTDILGLASGTYRLSGDGITVQIKRAAGGSMYVGEDRAFTIEDGDYVCWLYVAFNANEAINKTIYPMLNTGTTALPWEPYKGQTLTVPTPNGLPGIKVSSGGNYTDSTGQQWVCDEVDFTRGVYVQRCAKYVFDGALAPTSVTVNDYGIANIYFLHPFGVNMNYRMESICNRLSYQNTLISITSTEGYHISVSNAVYIRLDSARCSTVEEANAYLANNPIELLYVLETPIETPLTEEELAQFAALQTNYPTTTVLNDEGVGMEVSYVADTKNYIDKKINELRLAIVANV